MPPGTGTGGRRAFLTRSSTRPARSLSVTAELCAFDERLDRAARRERLVVFTTWLTLAPHNKISGGAVIGAGPMGSFTAERLARAGLRVLMLEKDPVPGASTVCGGGMDIEVPRGTRHSPTA